MNTSPLLRNTMARKPSHFGSNRNASPAGSSSAGFASIGSIGGATGDASASGAGAVLLRGGALERLRVIIAECSNDIHGMPTGFLAGRPGVQALRSRSAATAASAAALTSVSDPGAGAG